MMSHRFWFVTFASAGILVAAACAGTPTPLWTAGVAGNNNGLLPEVYHGTKEEIDVFMQTVPSKITPAQYDQLRDHAERIAKHKGHYPGQGDRLLHDIIGCALKSTESLPVNRSIHGEEFMTPDADAPWPWQPVPLHWPGDIFDVDARTRRREDIHTCLITHLNAYAVQVPIFLSGPHVTPGGDPTQQGFKFEEAVWSTTIEDSHDPETMPTIYLDVWPIQKLAPYLDEVKVATLLKTRICGTLAGAPGCNVHPYTDLTTRCKKTNVDDGIWSCCDPRAPLPCPEDSYRPAIETHLGDCGWSKLYGSAYSVGVKNLSKCSDPSVP